MFENLKQGWIQLCNLFLKLILALLPDRLTINHGTGVKLTRLHDVS